MSHIIALCTLRVLSTEKYLVSEVHMQRFVESVNNLQQYFDDIKKKKYDKINHMMDALTNIPIKANEFCADKTADELKYYLATQKVAYNDWKDADIETLIKLVEDAYFGVHYHK